MCDDVSKEIQQHDEVAVMMMMMMMMIMILIMIMMIPIVITMIIMIMMKPTKPLPMQPCQPLTQDLVKLRERLRDSVKEITGSFHVDDMEHKRLLMQVGV